MGPIGMSEIVVILVIALIFLGPRKLPEIASGIGKAIREVRKASAGIKQELELDETIRKPLEDLREAIHLAPEELKRRDEEKKWREQWDKEEAERRAKQAEAGEQAAADGSHAENEHDFVDPHDPQAHHADSDGTGDTLSGSTAGDGAQAASNPAGEASMQEMPLGDSSLHEIGPEPKAPPPVPASAAGPSRPAIGPGAQGAADRTIAMSAPPTMEGVSAAPTLPSPKGSSLPPPAPGIAAGRSISSGVLPTLPTVGGTVPRPPVPGATIYGMPAPAIPGVSVPPRPSVAPAPGAPAVLSKSSPSLPVVPPRVAAADATRIDTVNPTALAPTALATPDAGAPTAASPNGSDGSTKKA